MNYNFVSVMVLLPVAIILLAVVLYKVTGRKSD